MTHKVHCIIIVITIIVVVVVIMLGQFVECKIIQVLNAAHTIALNNNLHVSNIRVSNCTLIYNVCPEAALT